MLFCCHGSRLISNLSTTVTGHWSEGSQVRRVTGPTVVVADVGIVSKREDGNSMVSNDTGEGKLMCRKN